MCQKPITHFLYNTLFSLQIYYCESPEEKILKNGARSHLQKPEDTLLIFLPETAEEKDRNQKLQPKIYMMIWFRLMLTLCPMI